VSNRLRFVVLGAAAVSLVASGAVWGLRRAAAKRGVVDSLVASIPAVRPLVDAGDTPFVRSPSGAFVATESATPADRRVTAIAPAHATGGFRAQGGGSTVTLTLAGASATPGETDRGSAVYREAYPGVDVIATSRPERLEVMYVLRSRPVAPLTLALGEDASIRPEPSTGALLLASGSLRLSGPVAVDARGVSRRGSYEIHGSEVTLSLPLDGLTYPVAIDPSVTVPTWSVLADDRVPGARVYDAERLSQEVHYVGDTLRDRVVAVRPVRSRLAQDFSRLSGDALGGDLAGDEFDFQRVSGTARDPATGDVTSSSGAVVDWRRGLLLESETWEWDGARWALVASAELPGLIDPSLAFDRDRGRTVLYGGAPQSFGCVWNALYGGVNSGTPFFCSRPSAGDSTYEYDGTSWTAKAIPVPPPPRLRAAMAWDSHAKRTILFGGRQLASSATIGWNPPGTNPNPPFPENMAGALLNDTWSYDGTSWTKVATGHPPPALEGATLVFDEDRNVAVLVGGHAANDPVGRADRLRIWEFDGTDWNERLSAAASGVPAEIATRRGVSAFWNPQRRRVSLFGGQVDRLPSCTLTDAQIASQLAALAGNAAALDALASTGCLGGYVHDLWEWNGGALSQVTGTSYGGMIDGVPVFRQSTALGPVSTAGGGVAASAGAPLLPWRFDGSTTHYPLRTNLERVHQTATGSGSTSPPVVETPPAKGPMISPPFTSSLRPWAGMSSAGVMTLMLPETGAALSTGFSTWQDVTPGTPFVDGAIDFAAVVWDESQSRAVMFDPRTGATWSAAEGGAWAKLAVSAAPPVWSVGAHVRRGADLGFDDDALLAIPKATFDGARGRAVMLYSGSLWELAGSAWTQITVPASLASCGAATSLAYDPARARTVIFGCTVPASTWEWDGTTLTYFPQTRVSPFWLC
jgi:hypothetical protein